MNIVYPESDLVIAKTCGCNKKSRQMVRYAFSNESHGTCLDKKDVIEAQICACEKLLAYSKDTSERSLVEKEVSELKMALDLLA